MRAPLLAPLLPLGLLLLTFGTVAPGVGAPSKALEKAREGGNAVRVVDLHSEYLDDPVRVVDLRSEYLRDPVGLDEPSPRLSWRLESQARGQRQSAYRVLVATTPELLAQDQGDRWDSGKVTSDQTVAVVYNGKALRSQQRYYWKVRTWDRGGQPSAWSAPASWSMALLGANDWKAQWISYRDTTPLHTSRQELYLPPARLYRREFQTNKTVRRATLYASALGLYELHLNGQRVGDALFTPGWSDYRKRAYYQTCDVTRQVANGANALGAVVADGWYSGYVGYGLLVGYGPNKVGRYFYGKTPALLAQLELEYADGTHEVINSDASWRVTDRQPIREADFLMGETYDARQELPGWDRPGFNAAEWAPAIPAETNGSVKAPYSDAAGPREVELGFIRPKKLEAYPGVPVRVTQELKAVRMTEPKPGVYIFDLGQNFSGVARLKVKGAAGTKVTLRFGEMLHPDGRLMTENLRRARATDAYILRGNPQGETWAPRFTYHGFQYVEVTGYPGKPGLDAITGVVMHSDTPLTSSFECSDPMANRLFKNVVWTQRANFFEIPTDCPQRDERLGWMGDAQIYVRAATYHADVSAFFNKWLRDVEESQLPNGAYPDYAPYPMFHGKADGYGTAWTDAGIICPYTIYQVYGDPRIIERHWNSMNRFMQFRILRSQNFAGVKAGNEWGDWLSLGETTPIEYVDAAYFAHSADLMIRMSRAVNRKDRENLYRNVFEGVRSRFQRDYLRPDGTLSVDTQTAYALALSFDLLPESGRQKAADRLAEKIAANGYRMATGFLGTRPLLPVLSEYGHHDLAVRLFQSRQFPSWGYEVDNGATSIWERWNSFTKDTGFGNAAMNSFSHYSFGAVSEWMFQSLAGLGSSDGGFKQVELRPGPPAANSNPDRTPIHWVKASYRSIHGTLATAWKQAGKRFEYQVTLPPNTTGTLYLPAREGGTITESGQPVGQTKGVTVGRLYGDRFVFILGSGTYRFVSE